MKNILPALSVLAMLSCTAATTQITAAQSVEPAASSTSSSPVAYVYVSGVYDIGVYKINAFAAAADGSLTPIPGEPFAGPVTSMAVNGKFFFGADTDAIHIDSYLMGKNGTVILRCHRRKTRATRAAIATRSGRSSWITLAPRCTAWNRAIPIVPTIRTNPSA